MLNWLAEILRSFWRLFIWWVVIQPWEQGLAVRSLPFRKQKRRRLTPGMKFRIPYVDAVFKQSTRLRFTTLRPQTLTTTDGHTITMSGVLGYSIRDIDRLYDTLHQAEDSLRSRAQSLAARYVVQHVLADCVATKVETAVERELQLEQYGLTLDSVRYTTWARPRVYRLIMDNQENIWEDALNTIHDDQGKKPA